MSQSPLRTTEIIELSADAARLNGQSARARRCARDPEACLEKSPPPTIRPVNEKPAYGVGSCLKEKFGRRWIHAASGCACEQLRRELDALSTDQVTERLESIVDGIYRNVDHLEGVVGLAIKAVKLTSPEVVIKWKIRSIVTDCLSESRRRAADSPEPLLGDSAEADE